MTAKQEGISALLLPQLVFHFEMMILKLTAAEIIW